MSTARGAFDAASGRLRRLPTAVLLGAACALQAAIAITVALTSTHNHAVWYSGGDATEYWTSSWMLAHGALPQTVIGYGVPLLWAWVPPLTGAAMISGLPVITLLQALVLVPLCALLVWAIGDLLFGRGFAWWALALWIAGPLLLLWGFDSSYAPQFRDLFLAPHWYGLTDMADFPSLVVVLAAAWAGLRMLQTRALNDAVLCGLCTGLLVGIKPANGFFVPAVALLVLATRSPRTIATWCGALVPALVTLTVWKQKGRGGVPLLSYSPHKEALGAGEHPVLAVTNRYVHLDWGHFTMELHDLAGVFWSVRLLEFLAIAGLLGALRRSPLKGAFLGLWAGAFLIVKGSSTLAGISTLNYYRYVEPGLPAYVLLAASVIFLVPRAGRAFAEPEVPRAWGRAPLAVAVVLLAAIPLVLVVAAPAATTIRYVRDNSLDNNAPISKTLAAHVIAAGDGIHLTWRAPDASSTKVYYAVYRSSTPSTCSLPPEGAVECDLVMKMIHITPGTSFVDTTPTRTNVYRVGMYANYEKAVENGSDLMLIGPATPVVRAAR